MPPSKHIKDSKSHWQLPAVDPALAIKYWHDGFGTLEIANLLGVRESLIYNFLSRCRERQILGKRTPVHQEAGLPDEARVLQGEADQADTEMVPGLKGECQTE
jgi:hypothetical protein